MMQLDPELPEMFEKLRKPYEDTLYVLGVKDCDAYLPTLEEAMKIAQAKAKQGPSAVEKEQEGKAQLSVAKAQEAIANVGLIKKKTEDIDVDNMFEAMAAKQGHLKAVQID